MTMPSTGETIAVRTRDYLKELVATTSLVSTLKCWGKWNENEAKSEVSSSEAQPELSLKQIKLAFDSKDNAKDDVDESKSRAEAKPLAESKKSIRKQESESRRMPFDQLPHLASKDVHRMKKKGLKLINKRAVRHRAPSLAPSFDVHPLLDFANAHFNLQAPHHAFLFQKPVDYDLSTRLEWEDHLLMAPLTRLPTQEIAIALQAFRNISGFMGTRASGKGKADHCFKLLRNIVPRSPALKDEIYCQLCKQLTRNPTLDAVLDGWLLFNACLVTFPPSSRLTPCLEKFISLHVKAGGKAETLSKLEAYACEALISLRYSISKRERKEIPSAAELRALQQCAPSDCTVLLADGTAHVIPVSSWTTSRELSNLVARKLGVQHEKAFALFETTNNGEELLVPDDERVVDLYAEWERTYSEASESNQKKKTKKDDVLPAPGTAKTSSTALEGYSLIYKAYLWVHVQDETVADIELYYIQAVLHVLEGKYVCDLDVAMELACYQLYCKYGNDHDKDDTPLFSDLSIHDYIPKPLLSASNRAAIADQLLETYTAFIKNLCIETTLQAQLAYLRRCKSQPFYGMTLYYVKNLTQKVTVFPTRLIVSISEMGLALLGADNDQVLALYPYAEIASWGYSATSFVFIIARGSEQTKYSFKTSQGKCINDKIGAYVDYIMSTYHSL